MIKESTHLRPRLTLADKALELSGWATLVSIWIFVLMNYSGLPETIPIHYNVSGEPDQFGARNTIFTLPIVATLLFLWLTLLNLFPKFFNDEPKASNEQASRRLAHTARLFRCLKLVIALVFGLICLQTTGIAHRFVSESAPGFLPVLVAMILTPTIYFAIQSFADKGGS